MFLTTLFALWKGVSDGSTAIVIVQSGIFAEASRQLVKYVFFRYATSGCDNPSCTRVLAQVELDFNSIERIVEYFSIPQEAPSIIEKSRPPAYWPSSNGDLVVDNLAVRYAPDLPAVLRNISFTVKPSEKIGVVRLPFFSYYHFHCTYDLFRSEGQDPENQP